VYATQASLKIASWWVLLFDGQKQQDFGNNEIYFKCQKQSETRIRHEIKIPTVSSYSEQKQ
jgi:hypothetical protein